MEKGEIFLIPTILSDGQLNTLPPAVSAVISKLDYFIVENERTARRFISALNLGLVISELEFIRIDKNSSSADVSRAIEPVLSGRSAGVMSEAGCPGIADPGSRIVACAHKHHLRVIPVPGPSSIFLALMASGFNGQHFTFHGYLPIDAKQRTEAIRRIEQLSRNEGSTHIFIETPYRNKQLLESVLSVCNSNTKLCIARDLTGPAEWIHSAPVGQWKGDIPELHKIPAVFLLSGV